MNDGYLPIENYGVVGDLQTVALVGLNGSVDFMCYPEFDSPTIFASLLDRDKGGFFRIYPQIDDVQSKQMYLPDTNILLTRFLASDGVGEIIDFMPIGSGCLIRRVKNVRGNMAYKMRCAPRLNYAQRSHHVLKRSASLLFIDEEKNIQLKLESTVPLHIEGKDGSAQFSLKEGETAEFLLMHENEAFRAKEPLDTWVTNRLSETISYWREWVSKSKYKGRWQETINRSALLLKLMTAKKYGSIIAAATFGLPEKLGGNRNWDYRYTWLRDAAFSLYALIRLGFTKEAGEFIQWMETKCPDIKKPGELGLMYSIGGKKHLAEKKLLQFEGYKRSSPVTIGNDAYKQLQLDIYGELIDSIYLYNKYGESISHDLWDHLTGQVNWLCDHWEQPDHGIWEIREGKQEFLYSRLMCWVAIDRMIRMARFRSFPYPEKWKMERDKIYYSIFNDFWDGKRGCFVQYKGAQRVDAATLLMPLTRFIGAKDPRWLSTLYCIEEDLVSDSLVYRYKDEAGLLAEGTFSLCSFWYVECLSRAGLLEKARFYFEKMLGYANHLGLYSEQIGSQGEHLGNFPQAFTHLGLISAAYNLNQNLDNARNKQID